MARGSVTEKPSETALFTALRRALAHAEFHDERYGPDDLAIVFLPPAFRFFLKFKGIRRNTQAKLDTAFPGMTKYLIARTAWFDGLYRKALEDRLPQIVLLGAGYDSRPYRFARQNQGTRVFELDSAPTQARKQQCLRKARVAIPATVTLAPIDFNRESLADVLQKAGWQSQQPSLFLWEGVSYYLQPEAVDTTLGFFSDTAHQHSVLAFDYAVTVNDENLAGLYGVKEFLQAMQAAHANEGLLFSIPEGEIEAFSAARNLKLVAHLDKAAIEREYLTQPDGSLLGQITGHFRFVTVRAKAVDGWPLTASVS